MKITYTKEETIALVQKHIANMLDVEVTQIDVSIYSTEFLTVTCTPVEKVTAPRRWIKDPSYQDTTPETE